MENLACKAERKTHMTMGILTPAKNKGDNCSYQTLILAILPIKLYLIWWLIRKFNTIYLNYLLLKWMADLSYNVCNQARHAS